MPRFGGFGADVELGELTKSLILRGEIWKQAFWDETAFARLMPILIGLTGRQKMSKSLGNYAGLRKTC